jgi:L-ascorbate metabolism protein UlaG (beta-lactamase superfamily)
MKVIQPNFVRPSGIRAYWIGHATKLIEINGINILTDPVFQDHASPIRGIANRVTPPACQIEDLPQISVVLISHDHWDHLEYSAREKLTRYSPGVKIFAPLVVSDLISGWGFDAVSFDWRQHLVAQWNLKT